MKLLGLLLSTLSVLIVLVNNSSCTKNSFEKLCYVRYLVKKNLLDGDFKIFNSNDSLDAQCEVAVNLTLDALRTSSKDPCIADFLSRKDIPDTLLKKYLVPQLTNGESQVIFDDRFSEFRKKTVNISVIACNNRETFKPDIAAMMRYARNNKESKEKELKCLETYIKKSPNFILSSECVEIVFKLKEEFNSKIDNDVRKAFSSPNDKLMDFECGKKKIEDEKMFERFSFFVVLATSRDMTDKQIEAVAKSTEGSVNNAQKTMFECLNWS